jgi:hypothetical protein
MILIYITSIQPFNGRFRNRIELFNDFGQILLTFHIMYFTDWVGSPDTQVMYGWVMIALSGVFICFNMSVILLTSFMKSRLICKRNYNYQKHNFTPGI